MSDDDIVDGDAKAILMVENADNEGEYKVFELSWDAGDDSDLDPEVSVTQVGGQDFGASLDGLREINLVGSDAYDNLIENGFGFV